MKTTLRLAAILTTIALGAGTSFGQTPTKKEGKQLNQNGGFEEGKGFYHLVRPENCAIDSDEVHRGQFSMRINATGESEAGVEDPMVVAGYDISAGAEKAKYVFRCVVKTKNVDPAHPPKVELVIRQAGADGEQMNVTLPENNQLIFDQDMDWTPYEVNISNLPADAVELGFWIRNPRQAEATLWIDEIEIREITK